MLEWWNLTVADREGVLSRLIHIHTRVVWEAQDVGNWKPFPNTLKLTAPLCTPQQVCKLTLWFVCFMPTKPHTKHFGYLPAATFTTQHKYYLAFYKISPNISIHDDTKPSLGLRPKLIRQH